MLPSLSADLKNIPVKEKQLNSTEGKISKITLLAHYHSHLLKFTRWKQISYEDFLLEINLVSSFSTSKSFTTLSPGYYMADALQNTFYLGLCLETWKRWGSFKKIILAFYILVDIRSLCNIKINFMIIEISSEKTRKQKHGT